MVASAMQNGTSSMRAMVRASKVFARACFPEQDDVGFLDFHFACRAWGLGRL